MTGYTIRMGVPEMDAFWQDLLLKRKSNTLNSDENELFTRFGKAITNLSVNTNYPASLSIH